MSREDVVAMLQWVTIAEADQKTQADGKEQTAANSITSVAANMNPGTAVAVCPSKPPFRCCKIYPPDSNELDGTHIPYTQNREAISVISHFTGKLINHFVSLNKNKENQDEIRHKLKANLDELLDKYQFADPKFIQALQKEFVLQFNMLFELSERGLEPLAIKSQVFLNLISKFEKELEVSNIGPFKLSSADSQILQIPEHIMREYFDCVRFAMFHHHAHLAFSKIFKLTDVVLELENWGFQKIKKPGVGDLVLYNVLKPYTNKAGVWVPWERTHVAIVTGDNSFVSKFGDGPIYKHKPAAVSLEYGSRIYYYRKEWRFAVVSELNDEMVRIKTALKLGCAGAQADIKYREYAPLAHLVFTPKGLFYKLRFKLRFKKILARIVPTMLEGSLHGKSCIPALTDLFDRYVKVALENIKQSFLKYSKEQIIDELMTAAKKADTDLKLDLKLLNI